MEANTIKCNCNVWHAIMSRSRRRPVNSYLIPCLVGKINLRAVSNLIFYWQSSSVAHYYFAGKVVLPNT
jgi:hypothetical protein